MTLRLIVNADDFGLTRGVNEAVEELHRAEVLHSATLMAKGGAFNHAVEIARRHPALGIGCHVVLTDGTPVSDAASISTLLSRDRRSFRPAFKDFVRSALLGRIDPKEVRREAVAQIRILQAAGLTVTHLDTHKHAHILPQIARPLLEAAEETGVRAVRNPFEPAWSRRFGQPPLLRLVGVALSGLMESRFRALPGVREGRITTTEGTLGISATGRLNAAALRDILGAAPEGTWELVCHPGHNDADLDRITTWLRASREIEVQALLQVLGPAVEPVPTISTRKSPQRRSLDLIHYGRLLDTALSSSINK